MKRRMVNEVLSSRYKTVYTGNKYLNLNLLFASTMTPYHGSNFRKTDTLWGKPPVDIPNQIASIAELLDKQLPYR